MAVKIVILCARLLPPKPLSMWGGDSTKLTCPFILTAYYCIENCYFHIQCHVSAPKGVPSCKMRVGITVAATSRICSNWSVKHKSRKDIKLERWANILCDPVHTVIQISLIRIKKSPFSWFTQLFKVHLHFMDRGDRRCWFQRQECCETKPSSLHLQFMENQESISGSNFYLQDCFGFNIKCLAKNFIGHFCSSLRKYPTQSKHLCQMLPIQVQFFWVN